MKKHLAWTTAAILSVAPLTTAAHAQQYDDRWSGDHDDQHWDPAQHYHGNPEDREMRHEDRVYRGSDGRYYCKRSNGTTGLVLGAVGGGVIGNALGGGTLGTLLGAGGGALLGKHLDEHHDADQNRRNGYVCR